MRGLRPRLLTRTVPNRGSHQGRACDDRQQSTGLWNSHSVGDLQVRQSSATKRRSTAPSLSSDSPVNRHMAATGRFRAVGSSDPRVARRWHQRSRRLPSQRLGISDRAARPGVAARSAIV